MSSSIVNEIRCLSDNINKSLVVFSPVCLSVNGENVMGQMVSVVNKKNGNSVPIGFFDPKTGDRFTGAVSVNNDQCACGCNTTVSACTAFFAWDIMDESNLAGGNTQELEIIVNGATVASIVHDYLLTSDNINKSTWYTPWTDAINSLDGWSLDIENDQSVNDNVKVAYRLKYFGEAPVVLEFRKGIPGDPNRDKYVISIDENGVMTTESFDFNTGTEFGTSPFGKC